MKAAAIDRFGPPSVIAVRTLPRPRPGPREVLIALRAAGVGGWDASIRDGSWKPGGRVKFPLVLGTDGAGIVVAKGARVRRFRLGDRVYGFKAGGAKGGFYAQYVAVDERAVGHMPSHLNFLQAAAGAVTGLTALQGVEDALKVRKGETVLIFGASGAVGTLAVQFAKLAGARVIATASDREAARVVRRLGSDEVVDARRVRDLARLGDLVPDGLDAVLALAGGEGLERCLTFLRKGGRLAYPNGIEPEPRSRRDIRRRTYDAAANAREFSRLTRAIDKARLRVPIAATFALADAADAHRQLRRHVVGRIVLRIPSA
jgi:NADPH:quinone reductase-like Zn-dependent oxidoreductase